MNDQGGQLQEREEKQTIDGMTYYFDLTGAMI